MLIIDALLFMHHPLKILSRHHKLPQVPLRPFLFQNPVLASRAMLDAERRTAQAAAGVEVQAQLFVEAGGAGIVGPEDETARIGRVRPCRVDHGAAQALSLECRVDGDDLDAGDALLSGERAPGKNTHHMVILPEGEVDAIGKVRAREVDRLPG